MPTPVERTEQYEHKLVETCCDVCKAKIGVPLWLKFENERKLWFFCSEKHKHDFSQRDPGGLATLQ